MRVVLVPVIVGVAVVASASGAGAQGRVPPPAPPPGIGVTPFPPLPPLPPAPRGGDGGAGRWESRHGDGWRGRYATPWWLYPYAVEPHVYVVESPRPSSPPVISGVTAIIDRRTPEPRPAPVPYDPRKASLTVIGAGADGGGGVMKLERPTPDSLHVTWLGAQRPVSEARVVVTDSLQQPLRSRVVTLDARAVSLSLAAIRERAAFVGIAVVHADGSRKTVLVPLR